MGEAKHTLRVKHKWLSDILEIMILIDCILSKASTIAHKGNANKILFDTRKLKERLSPWQMYFHVGEYPLQHRGRRTVVVDKPQQGFLHPLTFMTAMPLSPS